MAADITLIPASAEGGQIEQLKKEVQGVPGTTDQPVLSFYNLDTELFDVDVYVEDAGGNSSPAATTRGLGLGTTSGPAAPTMPPTSPGPSTDYTNAQIDALLASASAILPVTATRTADYTLALTDAGRLVPVSSATAVAITVPDHTSVPFPVGTTLYVAQDGAGDVTIAAASGVVVQTADGYKVPGQWLDVALHKRDLNTWVLKGGVQ